MGVKSETNQKARGELATKKAAESASRSRTTRQSQWVSRTARLSGVAQSGGGGPKTLPKTRRVMSVSNHGQQQPDSPPGSPRNLQLAVGISAAVTCGAAAALLLTIFYASQLAVLIASFAILLLASVISLCTAGVRLLLLTLRPADRTDSATAGAAESEPQVAFKPAEVV